MQDIYWDEIDAIVHCIQNDELYRFNVPNCDIILFGAGFHGNVAIDYFKSRNINILCYCDNNIDKHGKIINGLQCISPAELPIHKNALVVITSKHCVRAISEQLKAINIAHVSFDAYVIADRIDDVKRVYNDILSDEFSKTTYLAIIKSMLLGTSYGLRNIAIENAFFALPEFAYHGNSDVFVDCGAYTGDTVERFIWSRIGAFKKIYAFEPGAKQFNALKKRVERLNDEWALKDGSIECIQGAVGETDSSIFVSTNTESLLNTYLSQSQNGGMEQIKVYSLDSYLGREKVSLIKVDIEGSEMQMLKGTERLLRTCKPKLAVSIYHKPQDVVDIPLYIKTIIPEYKMSIRHHSQILVDTALYCYL